MATAPGVVNPVIVTPTGGNFAVTTSNSFEERLEEPGRATLSSLSCMPATDTPIFLLQLVLV